MENNRRYAQKDIIELAAELMVRSVGELRGRIALAAQGKVTNTANITFGCDLVPSDTQPIIISTNTQIDLNGFTCYVPMVINTGVEVEILNGKLSAVISGAGVANFASVGFTLTTPITGTLAGWNFTDAAFVTGTALPNMIECRLQGETASVSDVLSAGTLVGCTVNLIGSFDCVSAVDCMVTLVGDWVNAPVGGTGCNIFARNYTSTSTPIPAAFVADGDYGDITVSGSGTAWVIDSNVVGNSKIRSSAARSVIGRALGSSGNVADISAAANSNAVLRETGGGNIGFGNIVQSSVTNLVTDLAERVVGPASSDDNAIARFDGTTGKLIQNSAVTLDDNGLFAWAASTNGQLDCDKTITLNSDKLATNTDLLSIQRNGVATATVRAVGELVVGRNSANILLSDHLKTNRFGWDSEPTTYISHPSVGNKLDIVAGGTLTAQFDDVQIFANQDDPTTPAYSFQEAKNSGLTLNSALDKLLLVNNSETIASVDTDGLQVTNTLGSLGVTGNAFIRQADAAVATYSFHNASGTGFSHNSQYGYDGVSASYGVRTRPITTVSTTVNTTDPTVVTATPILTIPNPTNNTGKMIFFKVLARRTNNINEVNAYFGSIRVKRTAAGVVTSIMSLTSANEEIAACNLTATTVGTNTRLNVVGVVANSITWNCWAEIMEV